MIPQDQFIKDIMGKIMALPRSDAQKWEKMANDIREVLDKSPKEQENEDT